MKSFNPLTDLPMGLGMALSRNSKALEYFSSLSPDEQRQVIDGTHNLHSSQEMKSYVNQLGSGFPSAF